MLMRRLGEQLLALGIITEKDLERALTWQKRTGERLGRILIALGAVRRRDMYHTLATLWGIPFVDLTQRFPDPALVQKFDPERFVHDSFIPVEQKGNVVEVATAEAPNNRVVEYIQSVLGPVEVHFLATTEWDIDYAIRATLRDWVLDRATYGLYYRHPEECAYTVLTRTQFTALVIGVLSLIALLYFYPRPTAIAINLLVNLAFLAGIVFKFVIALAGASAERLEPVTQEEIDALKEEELPHYTILVPVYKEANIIAKLMNNLRALDYPPEKLEILLLLEENDTETIEAARAARPPETVTFVIVPDGKPKTKPKACNVGLFFARGEYLVIYDAEDRPDPDQLKKAVVAFRKGPENLACVQAALNYFNAEENFLTRMFTLEYSYWYDYMLPGLDKLRLPIPLGGTSNHFRTDVLRELGGWDPFNVTEDADLGIRAAARGYTVGVINSTTYEEANNHLGNWIRQRSRWIKGYMQTVLVHTRHPIELARNVGFRNLIGFIMLIGGTPTTFLAAPPLWLMYIGWLITRSHSFDFLFPKAILYLSLFNLLLGNSLMVYLNMLAVFKRRYYHLLHFALLNPVYWIFHSIAAYKALWQLLTKPFYWEKTIHGITRVTDEASPPPST